ncbi:hypothetical protein ASPZODRAFT_102885 [Penicilliopsis zonata CBS 506.65]|uniref:DUF6594 domain-containing protein n=1 Tax=Penicilliopsis zonata CBS 506.65 TaxID=1073090 RepID=A0A1L9S8Q5_9EURO|nr:hypothetical protein ASPZODRAFT_102885 [Penicilliopsis zonata CBS 506.65]OJJ43538.1 hypothetical protein ASPZODRAFT_102885 [Penicilliopsis zonata CBS 506.65]
MPKPPAQGYDKVAAFMTLDPGLCVFRRFARLNVKNLLYLQGELAYLQQDLDEIIEEDKQSRCPEKAKYPFSVWDLKESLNDPNPENQTQWLKVLEVRKLLNEYNNALLQHAQMLRLAPPEKSDLQAFQRWMDWEEAMNMSIPFSPHGQWQGENVKDLVALCSQHKDTDRFTRWVFSHLIPWFHQRWGHKMMKQDPEVEAYFIDGQRIRTATYFLTLLLSGVLPASAMILMYFLRHKTLASLIVILIYNLLFVLITGLMATSKRVDMFAMGTAFAAIMVAMITNSNPSS